MCFTVSLDLKLKFFLKILLLKQGNLYQVTLKKYSVNEIVKACIFDVHFLVW